MIINFSDWEQDFRAMFKNIRHVANRLKLGRKNGCLQALLKYIESDYALRNSLAIQFDCMHTALFIFIEVKAEQIFLVDVIVVKILGQLLFTLRVVFVTVPDFQLDDILLSEIIYDNICTFLVTGLSLNLIISDTVYNWTQI